MNIRKSKQLARDEDTKPAVLDMLANSDARLVRQLVAQNPNITTETLLKLGYEFPELIVTNPIFDLLLPENSESDFVKISLFRSATTPIDVLKKLVKQNALLLFCLSSLACPGGVSIPDRNS